MKVAAVTVLALIAGWLVYCIPLVRMLVWLNAAAISVNFRRPGLLVPIAVVELLVLMGLLWAMFWVLYQRWREANHV